MQGTVGLIPGSGRSSGGENGHPLQYSSLGNPMDRGTWWATVHAVTNSWTRLSTHTFSLSHTHTFSYLNSAYFGKIALRKLELLLSIYLGF